MALVTCPECNREISDQAGACPHCGLPMAKNEAVGKVMSAADLDRQDQEAWKRPDRQEPWQRGASPAPSSQQTAPAPPPEQPKPQHVYCKTQTVEQTGKVWKLQMVLSVLAAIIGTVGAVGTTGDKSGFVVLLVVGLVWFVFARVMAWWFHG